MDRVNMKFGGTSAEVISLNTVIVGSGAAGYNAALQLHKLGQCDIAIVTEGVNMGTSRNTGSDKQTYYKLSLSGDLADSPMDMARDLFGGKCVDGDIALVEASLSTRCFLQLCELDVPFPTNRYGEFVGYKTDHDPRARATSAGPLTSKMMTQALEKAVAQRNIRIFDGYSVISVLTDNGRAFGLLTLCHDGIDDESTRFVLFNCKNIIYAVGGPAGMYEDSVYPCGHSGASGVAFEAGIKGKNLTEWQYGLASINPRWNVSGTYMQVLPRFVSVDEQGKEHEFLAEYFSDEGLCLSMIFKKGYEWPFDCKKVMDGSSIIDLLVYREKVLRGRRVFLDFRSNPFAHKDLDFSILNEDALSYLENAEACFGTPIERLLHMNSPAVDLYMSKGVDLRSEMLEIALCAQHNNGGLDIDMWWQTNVKGLFCAGEAAGSHGIYRPGGSALNAGQAGSLRTAQYIAEHGGGIPLAQDEFYAIAEPVIRKNVSLAKKMIGSDRYKEQAQQISARMSAVGGAIRSIGDIKKALIEIRETMNCFEDIVKVPSPKGLIRAYRLRDSLISQYVYLSAMSDYVQNGGKSRGSALYYSADGALPEGLEECFRFELDNHELDGRIQEIAFDGERCTASWREVRPLPEGGGFFENVWRTYRENKNVF